MEMGCYRKILHISYNDREVRAKIQQATGPHEDLLTIVKRRELQWYGHVSRSLGLAKTILQGTVEGGRRQGTVEGGRRQDTVEGGRRQGTVEGGRRQDTVEGGRRQGKQEKRIREWTGLEFPKSQRAV